MKKILVLNQSGLDLTSAIEKSKEYFKSYIDLEYIVRDISCVPTNIMVYKEVQGFDKNTGLPATVKYMGLTPTTRSYLMETVKDEVDFIVFVYNMDILNIPSDSVVTSWTEGTPILPNIYYTQLCINQYFADQDKIWKALTHENLHAFSFDSNGRGIRMIDEMDSTITPNGIVPFKDNDNPFAPDGNYAHTLRNLKPYFDSLKSDVQKMHRLLRLTSPMMRGEDVKEIQSKIGLVKVDGWFGKQTEAMVKVFQVKNGLVPDGIVGSNTWKALDSVKKKV